MQLVVFDLPGIKAANLVNETKAPGTYETKYNGIDFPSGVNFYKL